MIPGNGKLKEFLKFTVHHFVCVWECDSEQTGLTMCYTCSNSVRTTYSTVLQAWVRTQKGVKGEVITVPKLFCKNLWQKLLSVLHCQKALWDPAVECRLRPSHILLDFPNILKNGFINKGKM